jgi:selenocysteine-specific translation elongation factor
LEGATIGVFGTDLQSRRGLEGAVAKKSETEGVIVYQRTDGGKRYSFLDVADFPEKIQGYAMVASIADHALYLYPKSSGLTAADGELAVLLGALRIPGTLELLDGSVAPESALAALKGTAVAGYPVEERQSTSSAIDLSGVSPRQDLDSDGPLVYVDRTFTVKGVGTVALGFVMAGVVSVHDRLRPVPGPPDLRVDVRGIQVSDVDFDSVGRGVRVGLALRGAEADYLQKAHWLDGGGRKLSDSFGIEFEKSPFYRQEVRSRDLHVEVLGETIPAAVTGDGRDLRAVVPWQVPAIEGLRVAILDLNGKSLRVAGGGTCRF